MPKFQRSNTEEISLQVGLNANQIAAGHSDGGRRSPS